MENFYICHPDDKKSCGACCGLYNYENFDRQTVSAALAFRTDLFAAMKPREGELEYFRSIVAKLDLRPRLLEEIYCCEFIGFVDDARRKVGCLIHPALGEGADMRDHAYYGAETCTAHKCPTYNYFSAADVRPVIAALDDWYLYGMCVTDIDLLKEFYRAVSDLRGEAIRPELIAERKTALEIFRSYLSLKENWPFRRGRRRFGQYIFENGSYRVADTDWEALGVARPQEWRILRSLASDFSNADEVLGAVNQIRRLVTDMASALSQSNH